MLCEHLSTARTIARSDLLWGALWLLVVEMAGGFVMVVFLNVEAYAHPLSSSALLHGGVDFSPQNPGYAFADTFLYLILPQHPA